MKFVVKTLRTAILVTLVSLLVAASGWAQSEEQQSLGDVARQEKAKKPKKVITDEDLPQGTAASGSASASPSSTQSSEEKGQSEAKEGEEKAADEGEEAPMTKAQQADEAKKQVEDLKQNEAATERGLKRYEEMVANETDESRRELYQNALKHGQGNLAELQKKRAQAEKEAAEKEAAAKEEQPNPPPE